MEKPVEISQHAREQMTEVQGKKRFLQQLDREKESQLEWDELCIERRWQRLKI